MNELITIQQEPADTQLETRDPESSLRYALERGASVDVIERLVVVRRELQAEASKRQFHCSLGAFQAECPVIAKRKFGARNAYKYAPLDDIVHQTFALMRKHGFNYSITAEIEPGWVKAQCKITHSGGHAEVSEFKVPIDGNMKNMMTDPQRYGAAMTFAKRYALCNGFGILTADEDTDAVAERPEGKSEPQKGAGQDPKLRESVTPSEASTRIALKKRIWDRCKGEFQNTPAALENWLVLNSLMTAGESLATLPEDRLEVIAERVEEEFDAPA